MRISIILTKKILLHRDKDANLNVNKMVKSREFQHLRNFLQETSLSESLSLFLCIFCDPFLPRIKAIATNTASSCRPNTVLQPLFGFPTNQNHFRTIFLVQITSHAELAEPCVCIYINTYVNIYKNVNVCIQIVYRHILMYIFLYVHTWDEFYHGIQKVFQFKPRSTSLILLWIVIMNSHKLSMFKKVSCLLRYQK